MTTKDGKMIPRKILCVVLIGAYMTCAMAWVSDSPPIDLEEIEVEEESGQLPPEEGDNELPPPEPQTHGDKRIILTKAIHNVTSTQLIYEDMPQFTICMLTMTGEMNPGTLFSYKNKNGIEEMFLRDPTDLKFMLKGNSVESHAFLSDNDWHHVCVTWDSTDGAVSFYKDGLLAHRIVDIAPGETIAGEGTFILGQNTDPNTAGSFPIDGTFLLEVTNLNMWNVVLDAREIHSVFTACDNAYGVALDNNNFKWNVNSFVINGDMMNLVVDDVPSDLCTRTSHPWVGENLAHTSVHFNTETAYIAPIVHIPDMSEVTACLWVKTADIDGHPNLFSYAVLDQNNELVLYDAKDLVGRVKGTQTAPTEIEVNDGSWHHVCFSWTSTWGQWKLYKDGIMMISGAGLSSGDVLTGGGSFIVGQEQDWTRGSFDPNQALDGEVTYVNIWSKAVPDTQVNRVYLSCGGYGPDSTLFPTVFSWGKDSTSRMFVRETITRENPVDTCPDTAVIFGYQSIEFNDDSYVTIQSKHPIPTMDAVTICMWIEPHTNDGKLLTYNTRAMEELSILNPSDLTLVVHENTSPPSFHLPLLVSSHVCMTWSSRNGYYEVFVNGSIVDTGDDLSKGHSIKAGGVVVLGDTVYSEQSQLRLTGVHIYDRVISDAEIKLMANDYCLIQPGGNLYNWKCGDLSDIDEANIHDASMLCDCDAGNVLPPGNGDDVNTHA